MKGYAGGLVVSTADRKHIGLLGFWPDDAGVSFTVLVGLHHATWHRQRLTPDLIRGRCAKVRRQGYPVADTGFQLESLILAQNERWRQA